MVQLAGKDVSFVFATIGLCRSRSLDYRKVETNPLTKVRIVSIKKFSKMKLTGDFLVRELRDDEMLVVNGGLSSPLTGGEWCGVGCNGSDGNACGIGCGGTTTPEIPDVPVTPEIPITNKTNL